MTAETKRVRGSEGEEGMTVDVHNYQTHMYTSIHVHVRVGRNYMYMYMHTVCNMYMYTVCKMILMYYMYMYIHSSTHNMTACMYTVHV